MNKDNLNPALQRILNDHGFVVKSASKRKSAEEAQDGVGSELRNEDGGKSIDQDAIFDEYSGMAPSEGGTPINDGNVPYPDTPDGEESSFETYMTGGDGGAETKKTVEDPGYQGASVTSDLSISGSTVDKGAAFIQRLQKFASTQKDFVNKIAMMAKIAEGIDAEMAGAEMDPAAAMAGMAGPGQAGSEDALLGGEGGGEMGGEGLTPEDEALIEAIIQTQTGEDPLTPEERAQIDAILNAGDGEELPPEAMMAGGGGELPPEALMGAEGGMAEEPVLSPEEGKIASAILDFDIKAALEKAAEEDEEDNDESDSECSEGECDSSDDEAEYPEMSMMQTSVEAPGAMPGGEEAELLNIIESLPPEQVDALITLLEGGEGDTVLEPEVGDDELGSMLALASAADETEYKEACYYGMTIPEYRVAKDNQIKQAMLQAKNAEQGKKAKRYGQTIDSLIKK
jgi:hypothetical protein